MPNALPDPTERDPLLALTAAVRAGQSEVVAELLARHPSLSSRLDEPAPGEAFGATLLILAVNRADRASVELLLAGGADPNQRSHWWAGGFHVLEHDHGLADFLIARGARLDAKSASQLGRLGDLEALVKADPEAVHMRAGDGQTPLHVAPTVAIAEFLLTHGADIDARDVDHESTPAQYLVRSHADVARFLVARGARTDLLMAAALGLEDHVRAFLESDPACVHMNVSPEYFPMRNPHAGGTIYTWTLGHSKTAHALAREFGHEGILRLLMEHSPEVVRLAALCETGDEVGLAALLAMNPDIARSSSSDAIRRLPDAAQHGDPSAVRLMLRAGWPVDARGQHGATALHWAGFHGDVEITRAVLAHGPALETKDWDYGLTALGWTLYGSLHGWRADRGDFAAVLELLLAAGASAPPPGVDVEASAAALAVLRRAAD